MPRSTEYFGSLLAQKYSKLLTSFSRFDILVLSVKTPFKPLTTSNRSSPSISTMSSANEKQEETNFNNYGIPLH